MTLTSFAFSLFRAAVGEPRLPPRELIANDDQLKKMNFTDGLNEWKDGAGTRLSSPSPPLLTKHHTKDAQLWVVRQEDVVYAKEHCAFGETLESNVIKHTNLTGGDAAFSGGELIFLDDNTIVLNGCSGRYGPRSKAELDHVVRAFVDSGYGVWSMGFDEETNRPALFLGTFPEWVV